MSSSILYLCSALAVAILFLLVEYKINAQLQKKLNRIQGCCELYDAERYPTGASATRYLGMISQEFVKKEN